MRVRALQALALLAVQALPISAQQRTETGFLNCTARVANQSYRYQVYVPADYTPNVSWPVILFLHGGGERGSDGLLQTTVGLAPAIRRDPSLFPAIAVFPQAPPDLAWAGTPADVAMTALRQTISEFHADPDRVYLTGLSLGGHGAWYLIEFRYEAPGKPPARLRPNPRLQRTRSAPLRSPLSRKPFGDADRRVGGLGPWLDSRGRA